MRLFIGIAPDRAATQALAHTAQALRAAVRGRYVRPEMYHMTLAFLGQVDEGDVPRVRAAMRAAAATAAPFALRLGALGTFGDVLWRGVEDSRALLRLATAVRAALDGEGIPYDGRAFRPHFTLARRARGQAADMALPGAAFDVDTILLYESVQAQGRAAYAPCLAAPLAGQNNP